MLVASEQSDQHSSQAPRWSVTFPAVSNGCQTRKSISRRRSSSAPSVVCRHPSRLCHGQNCMQPTSPIECGPRTVALDARAHHDLHHVNVAASATTTICFCSSTARTGHGHSLPLAGGMHHLPVHAASEFGDPAMALPSCGRATRSCVVHASGPAL